MTTVLEATENKLQLQRTFAASIERVWAAWTDPNQVYRWFGCPESKGISANIDLKVGGAYEVHIIAHGQDMTMKGVIAELELKRKLVIEWSWDGNEDMAGLPPTRAEIAMKEVKGGTQVTLTHSGFPNAEVCGQHQQGWSASLERIDNFVDSAEAEIFEAIRIWDNALWNKDAGGIVEDYSDDCLLYDIFATCEGPDAIKKLWEQCLPFFGDNVTVLRKDLKLRVMGDAAVMTFLTRCTGMKAPETDNGELPDMMKSWFRGTVVYQKIDGEWKAVHEHISLPVDCMSQKPAYILD